MTEAAIYTSKRQDKKYTVLLTENGKVKRVSFGAKGYEDYTIHHDDDRKNRYIQRHAHRENWNSPTTAGFWSRWLLWNQKTLKASAADITKKFGIKVKLFLNQEI